MNTRSRPPAAVSVSASAAPHTSSAGARLLLALPLAFPDLCLAGAETLPPPVPDPLTGVGQMLFGLFIVLAILAGCVWLLKRVSTPMRGGGLLRVVGAAAVGPRERAVLLEVGDRIILLGVTPNNVRTLHVFTRDELPAAVAPTPAAAPVALTAFAARLRQALHKRQDDAG
ncbi:MAG: flagellar biosynthetic protein FliO [Azoarcus sp.]|nr:flagellar biosynthetic protein FliO [Azoarcus sp.]